MLLGTDAIAKAREGLLTAFDNWSSEFPRAFDEQEGRLTIKFTLKIVGFETGQVHISHEIGFDQKSKIKDNDLIVVNPVQKKIPGM